jgi:YihY family inner membrane protein
VSPIFKSKSLSIAPDNVGTAPVTAASEAASKRAAGETASVAPGEVIDAETAAVEASAKKPSRRFGMFRAVKTQALPTLKYLATTEVHTYAFSVAANAILSFFPAIVLFLTISSKILHNQALYDVVVKLAKDFLPSNQDFIVGSMQRLASHRHIQVISLVMLLVSSTGVFLPLEVALNKVWGIRQNRSYVRNQLVSLALTFGCGACFMISAAAKAKSDQLFLRLAGSHPYVMTVVNIMFDWPILKLVGLGAMVSMFFLIYWVLPNGKVPARSVFPAALVTGILFDLTKHAYTALLPLLSFQDVYGPFYVSVTLIFWAFWVGMLLLGGAHLSAADHLQQEQTQS